MYSVGVVYLAYFLEIISGQVRLPGGLSKTNHWKLLVLEA